MVPRKTKIFKCHKLSKNQSAHFQGILIISKCIRHLRVAASRHSTKDEFQKPRFKHPEEHFENVGFQGMEFY